MASRSIDALAPAVKVMALAFLRECQGHGLEVLIYCTLRTNQEQAALYQVGRTKPGRILTNARPGDSLHNPDENGEAWAFDAVPMRGGKPQWDDAQALQLMGRCGEAAGLVWAGRWRGKLRETVHFQGERNGRKGALLVA